MSLPRVSCVVAAYNYGRFLPAALDSALASDYPQDLLEVIVVDDGSTDDTPRAIEPYLDRVHYVRKPNGGLLSTVNRGIAEATGDLIALLSADDLWPPEKVRRQVDFLAARPEVGLVYSDMELIDAAGRRIQRSYFEAKGVVPHRGRVLGQLVRHCFVAGGSLMVRASLRDRFHPIPPHAAWEDWWIALRVAEVAEIDYIDEPLYGYRSHGDNMFLGVDGGDRLLRVLREDAPWRRWMLTHVDPDRDDVTADDFLHCYSLFAAHCEAVAAADGRLPFDVSDSDRRRSREAVEAGGGVKRLVRALAFDPANSDARGALERPRVRQPAPSVTCIVPTYNYERFLPRALDSALAQRYPSEALEIVVVDDGSTDATPEVMRGYQARRVRYVRQDNRGLTGAVNTGLELASGELLAFLDADDMWPPDKLALQTAALAANPAAGLVYGDMEVVDADERVIHDSFMAMTGLVPHRGRVLGRLVCRNFVTAGSIVVRASLRERFHPIDPIAPFQDWWIAVRVAEVAEIEYIPAIVARYRHHGDNMVLGVGGGAKLHLLLRDGEIPFRRWLLQNVDVDEHDMLEAYGLLLARAREAAAGLGVGLEAVLPATDVPAAVGGVKSLVRALAADPFDAAATAALERELSGLSDARSFTTLAFADELLADRALLASYADAFDDGDDATLVVHGPGLDGEQLFARLAEALGACGIDADAAPDVLARPAPAGDDGSALVGRVEAVLSRRTGTADVGALRALAEKHWREAHAGVS